MEFFVVNHATPRTLYCVMVVDIFVKFTFSQMCVHTFMVALA